MKIKCIKEKCPYYYESDTYYEVCRLTSKYCVIGDCIGFNNIRYKMEEIACKISNLMNEYNRLECLEDWIKDNQEIKLYE